jgi:hypothetical protein
MTNPNIVPLRAADDVIFGLHGDAREKMADCLRNELDPPIDATITFVLGPELTATVMSNGWTAVYRVESKRDIFHLLGTRVIVLHDLLTPESAIASGLWLNLKT